MWLRGRLLSERVTIRCTESRDVANDGPKAAKLPSLNCIRSAFSLEENSDGHPTIRDRSSRFENALIYQPKRVSQRDRPIVVIETSRSLSPFLK